MESMASDDTGRRRRFRVGMVILYAILLGTVFLLYLNR